MAGEPGTAGESSGGADNSGGVGGSAGESSAGADHSGGSGGHDQGGEGGDAGNAGEGGDGQGGDDGNGGEGGAPVEIDDCPGNSCLHGSCVDGIASYTCSCDDGWTGESCDSNIDDCPGNSCLHGSCVDDIGSYTCSCDDGWTGESCDSNIDDCPGNSCLHGSCVDGIGSYTCSCDGGWTGESCDSNIDDCPGNSCLHGSCVDGIGSYTCSCDDGWTGESCDSNIDDCPGNSCLHGSCVDGVGSYTCSCDDGWTGESCDSNIDDCPGNSCLHGSCVDGIGSYTCSCDIGWTGESCDSNIDDCAEDPCGHGECADELNGFSCSCDIGWTGESCDTCEEGYSGADCDTCSSGYYDDGTGCVRDPLSEVCVGTTSVSGWTQYSPTTVTRLVDTSSCAFEEPPLYFTSVYGNSMHWTARGVSSIYLPAANSFRTYLAEEFSFSVTDAQNNGWQVAWAAVENGIHGDRLCTGQTDPTTTDWTDYAPGTVYTDVTLSDCGFSSTPRLFTSLGGDAGHVTAFGVTSIYTPTATGFRVYVTQQSLSAAQAETSNYFVNWMAVDPNLQSNVACSGQTATGTTNWQTYNSDIYTDVSTSACNFSHTPVFLTTLGGASNHFLTTGANALYGATASGFRTYIDFVNNSISPAGANSLQWRMAWIGF